MTVRPATSARSTPRSPRTSWSTSTRLRHRPGPPPPPGTVIGVDLTPEMLATARRHGRDRLALLALADARRLRDDDLLAPGPLDRLLQGSGWSLAGYDDGPDRFLAQADRITLGT